MRRFITKIDIDALLEAGQTLLECGAGDDDHRSRRRVRAFEGHDRPTRGRRRGGGDSAGGPGAASSTGVASGAPAVDPAERAAVRAAVVAALGSTPPNLDAIIDRAIRGQ